MSYATPSDVASLNKARIIGQGQNPNVTDVQTYLDMSAGEIDSILLDKGYDVPVNASAYPEAFQLLRSVNAKGGWAMMEESSANSVNLDRAKAAYDAALKLLSDGKLVMDVDMETERSQPRGPYLTYQPDGRVYDPDRYGDREHQNRALPLISRTLRF